MGWRSCDCRSSIVRTTRNLSRNESDHIAAAALGAVNTFIIARNADASFKGSVAALCIE